MWTGIDMGIHVILIKLFVSLNYYVRLIEEILPLSLSLSLSLSSIFDNETDWTDSVYT